MIPEGKYIENEIILRKLENTSSEIPTRKSVIRKIVLSLGLVNPNESRTLVFDIFDILLLNSKNEDGLSIKDIHQKLKQLKKDVSIKSVYYHIERMTSKGIVKKRNGNYKLIGGINAGGEIKEVYMAEISGILNEIEAMIRKLNREL